MGPVTATQHNIALSLDAREKAATLDLLSVIGSARGPAAGPTTMMRFEAMDKAGSTVTLAPTEVAAFFQDGSQRIKANKKAQSSICVGVSSTNRRRDEDIDQLNLLLLDSDNAGEPDKIKSRLDELGLAYVMHETWSSGWKVGKGKEQPSGVDPSILKWHAILFLSDPILIKGAHPKTKEDIRNEYRWIAGVFSELAGLRIDPPHVKNRCVGFDPVMYDVLGRLSYVGNRPHKSAPARQVWHKDGATVGWDEILRATGYYQWLAAQSDPVQVEPPPLDPVPPPDRRGVAVGPDMSLGDKLVESFRVAGLLGSECRPGCYRVRCPWEGEHTEKSGGRDSSTVIWTAMPGGFVCQHSHCAGRRAKAIREWFRQGYPAQFRRIWGLPRRDPAPAMPPTSSGPEDIEDMPPPEWVETLGDDTVSAQESWPDPAQWLQKGPRGGVKDGIENVRRVFERHPFLKGSVYYSEFTERPIWTRSLWDAEIGSIAVMGAPVTDHDITNLRCWFSTFCRWEPSTDNVNAALESVALKNKRHEVRDYLADCRNKWDGQQRVNDLGDAAWGFLARREDGTPTPESLMLRKWLLGAVRRVMDPGCQQDYCVVFSGNQGVGKSQALRAIFGEKWIARGPRDLRTKESQSALIGKWGIELAELTSFDGATQDRVKEYLDTQTDHVRLPYARREREIKRQCVFAGTTNLEDFIGDHTGGRRFWPIAIQREIDLEYLRAHRDLIWGEIMAAYEEGEATYFTREEEQILIKPLQDSRLRVEPVIAELVDAHITEMVDGRPPTDNDRGQTGILAQCKAAIEETTEDARRRTFEAADRMRRFTIWGLARANRFSQPDTAARHSRQIELCLKRMGIGKGAKVNERTTSMDRTKVREYVVPWALIRERAGQSKRDTFDDLERAGFILDG